MRTLSDKSMDVLCYMVMLAFITYLHMLMCMEKNDIIKRALEGSKKVCAIASEEEDSALWLNDDGPYVVVFDPLDGSRNIDASIPTGSIFGIYRKLEGTDAFPSEEKAELNVLQRGDRLIAAIYALYSSATILCLSLGSGTHAFTLDHSTGDFVLTNANLSIPERGTKTFPHLSVDSFLFYLNVYQCLEI